MLVFFTLYLQEGLSREYGAELGADVLLQVCCSIFFSVITFFSVSFVSKVVNGFFLKHTLLMNQVE